MKPTQIVVFCFVSAIMTGCGGGSDGSATAGNRPQLAASLGDVSDRRSTFADRTLVEGDVITSSFNIEKFINFFKVPQLISNALAQTINSCNDNVIALTIETSQQENKFKKLSITEKNSDLPCFTSSQEVGNYIAVQAKNLFQGEKKCDIALLPKYGGRLHCLSAEIPNSILNIAGDPEFKFSQAFAGISSLKSLGGKITDNGKYFFIAFSDDGTKNNGYDGVYRIDLTGQSPVGQLAYIASATNPRALSFDGYQQLENGDIIVTRMDLTAPSGSQRRYTYYVGVSSIFPGVSAQQIVLINSALEFGFDQTNSPIFAWAINNLVHGGEQITNGSSQNIVFSGSQDPLAKIFYFIIGVNRYQSFTGDYFNKLLIKGTVLGDSIYFEDYGPTSLSFFGTAGIKNDLTKIYWIKDWTLGQMTVVTRDVSKLIDGSDRDYLPEVETNIIAGIPHDYRSTLLYTTENSVFISAVQFDFYDNNGLMNLKMYVADKVLNGTYWTERGNAFNEVDFAGYTGSDFRVHSIIPSLVTDNLNFRINKISDNSKISLDVKATGVDAINLGSRGAISNKHAVVKVK